MVLAGQIPVAISSCPLIQLEQTFLLFLLCFQKSKFFTVEDLCRFWHLWTDFNYANVPSIYTFLSRNIYYCLPATIWIDLHYLYSIPVMFLAFRPEFRGDLHLYFFFLWLDAFVTWCYLSNLTTKNASWNLLFFPDVSVRPYVSKAIAAALWANLKDKKWISLLSWKILF